MNRLLHSILVVGVLGLLGGCGEPAKTYDPQYIASEANNGNSKPILEVMKACEQEVATAASKKIACAAYNEALSIRSKEPIDHNAMRKK